MNTGLTRGSQVRRSTSVEILFDLFQSAVRLQSRNESGEGGSHALRGWGQRSSFDVQLQLLQCATVVFGDPENFRVHSSVLSVRVTGRAWAKLGDQKPGRTKRF